MKEYILENGVKLIYKKNISDLTSICISLDAGALRDEEKYGVAHATEHMVYKGTKNRSEEDINKELSEIFGFQNAMTNYPYVIYYGTLLGEDLERGIELFSDIIINPSFKNDGFKEEMSVIVEELKEWDEDLEQYLEDKLFLNAFKSRRIKYPIIGTFDSLKNICLEDIKGFYKRTYFPRNTKIAVVTSLDFDIVLDIVKKYFEEWNSTIDTIDEITYENPSSKVFEDIKGDIKTNKIQINYPIDKLSEKEVRALRIFNEYFGEGINSKLFDTLRTKNGLVYDVLTRVCHENGIKFYKITFSTAKENVNKSLSLIDECVYEIKNLKNTISEFELLKWKKSFKLKRLFREEQSIVLAKELSTYETMFNDYKVYINETDDIDYIDIDFIIDTLDKVFKNKLVQIIK
ncbi:insulinase family protein [Clostridium sardiniense]|uniref:Insulinase family protein n=1 Tax=Clostridium sardiniense TaxID=29369 RepID=A0ABS7L089_CLOSR|nr:pitrilysin family protein [Clostridium sardiniense]MBY0756273.1 insulinase family protein [Clostridium sardiniense]MDQ0458783.1 putative Zn-dependent peptidase [Clostridium sardiniense]